MSAVLKGLVAILAATSAVLLYFIVHEFNPFLHRCNPDVCHSYALSAFRVHSHHHQDSSPCQYGSLPGTLNFNVMQPAGARWQTAGPDCQLRNLLMPSAAMGHVKVLLLGDSVDAHLTREWCTELQQPLRFTPPASAKGSVASFAAAARAAATGSSSSNASLADADECCKDRGAMYYCRPDPRDGAAASAAAGHAGAGTGSVSLGMYHILGVHLDGPFHTGAKGNFLTRVPLALKTFTAVFGAPPDLVLLHSNFWDQSRMWEQQQPGYGHLSKLPPEVVFSWSSNFSLLLSTTAELLPDSALMATRTAAFPAFSANWLGRWPYIHQLNMAASEVARLHDVPVIDLAGMVFGLEPRQYLQDQHHPNKVVLLECANIAMNLLRQHQQQDLGQVPADDVQTTSAASQPPDYADGAAGAAASSSSSSMRSPTNGIAMASSNSTADAAGVAGGGNTAAALPAWSSAAPGQLSGTLGVAGSGDADVSKQLAAGRPAGQQASDAGVDATRKALNSSQQQGGQVAP